MAGMKAVRLHEINRRRWNALSIPWQEAVGKAGVWRRCVKKPSLVLTKAELALLRGVRGKRVCVLGSGDNKVVFALAGMGARVTSVDISEQQLATAAKRAGQLGLNIRFVRADVTRLPCKLPGQPFDVVYTGGHVAVWISDLRRSHAEAARILRKGGRLIVSEYHPFRRIWKDKDRAKGKLILERAYLDHRIQRYVAGRWDWGSGPRSKVSYEFMWTISDFWNSLTAAGISLDHFSESGSLVEEWEPPVKGLPHLVILSGRKS